MIIVSIDGSRTFRDNSSQKKRSEQIAELCREAEKSGGHLISGTELPTIVFDGVPGSGRLRAVLFLEGAARIFSLHEGDSTGIRLTADWMHDTAVMTVAENHSSPHEITFPGISLTRAAAEALALFAATEPLPGNRLLRISRFTHRSCRCPVSSLEGRPRSADIQAIAAALSALTSRDSGISRLTIAGPFRAAKTLLETGLDSVCADYIPRFPIVGPGPKKRNIYAPIADAIDMIIRTKVAANIHHDQMADPRDRSGIIDELTAWVVFFRRYPYRTSFGDDAIKTLELKLTQALHLHAELMQASELPALVIVHEPSEFHPDCLSLIEKSVIALADSGLRLVMVGTGNGSAVPSPGTLVVRTMGMSFFDTIQAARRGTAIACPPLDPGMVAKAANQDPLRLALILDCPEDGSGIAPDTPTEDLIARSLKKTPPEYLAHLVISGLSEGVLDTVARAEFLLSEGYTPDESRCIDSFFESLGFMEADSGHAKLANRDAPLLARELMSDKGASVMASFIALLGRKMQEGSIKPCLSIYRTMKSAGYGTDRESQSLVLDCMMEESAVNPLDSGAWTDADTPLAAYPSFLAAYARGLGTQAGEQLKLLQDSVKNGFAVQSLAATLASLSEASVDYAEHRTAGAAALAKTAVLGVRSFRSPRVEARAQRILGLCALAGGQLIQGCAYLSNAGDIAAPAPDPAECARAKIAEAGACLVLGDFDRAGILGRETVEIARQSYRPDFEEIGLFILARIDYELGRYDDARSGFRNLASTASLYAHEACGRRALVWCARASFAIGDTMTSRAYLELCQTDAEAQWFLAEGLSACGLPEEAFIAADRAAFLLGFGPGDFEADGISERYASADRFSWDDGFTSLEGSSVGFASSRSLAAEQAIAFRYYAQSMFQPDTAELNIERLLSLAREKRLAVVHPYAYLYFYYAYRLAIVGECSGQSPLNLLGRAFKALQLRAGKLFVESDFKDFFESNRENAAIMRAARRSKLM